ncbi:MAG: TrkA family potassium uptake protein [Acidimicrobiales bacterium]|nr:TrkA family potassium uptake protein [Acidimicrobiales bacterium]
MKVVIAGGGKVGRFMAEQLHGAGHEVLILDQDRDVIGRHQADIAGVPWKRCDACEVSRLAEAGLETADVVAAVTGDDEDNLVISLLSKQEFGVPRVVARVNNPKNEWMFNESWGVDISVSTPHLLTSMVEEAVSVGTLVRLLSFEGGKARLSEVKLADGSPAQDREILELGFPRDSTVVAVIRKDKVIVPRGDTLLRVGDEVLVLVTDDSEPEVKAILVGEGALGAPGEMGSSEAGSPEAGSPEAGPSEAGSPEAGSA